MAHRRIKISRAPWIKDDGSVSTKKVKYRVTCRSKGKVCWQSDAVKGYSAAEELKRNHHGDHDWRHACAHPNDNISKRRVVTPKQKPSRPTYDMGGAADFIRGIAARALKTHREK